MQRRSRGVSTGLILLLSQILHVGVNNIPPVTLATLALNIWLFLSPLKPLHSSCLSVEKCYQQRDWQRLLLAPLHHADDWHLYFNMASMLWKGIHLERRLGSRQFAYVLTTFSVLTGVVYLVLEFTLAEFMDEPDFRRNCAVGFSGVLFALKVLNNHYCPGGFVNVLGFPVPNRFACWAELVAIHFFTPGTSFAGHLAGILVGLMYVHGPLKKIMETCAGIFSSNVGYPRQQYHFNSSGYSGYPDPHRNGRPGSYEDAPRNYDAYTAGLSEEEQLERALRASLWDQVKAMSPLAPTERAGHIGQWLGLHEPLTASAPLAVVGRGHMPAGNQLLHAPRKRPQQPPALRLPEPGPGGGAEAAAAAPLRQPVSASCPPGRRPPSPTDTARIARPPASLLAPLCKALPAHEHTWQEVAPGRCAPALLDTLHHVAGGGTLCLCWGCDPHQGGGGRVHTTRPRDPCLWHGLTCTRPVSASCPRPRPLRTRVRYVSGLKTPSDTPRPPKGEPRWAVTGSPGDPWRGPCRSPLPRP